MFLSLRTVDADAKFCREAKPGLARRRARSDHGDMTATRSVQNVFALGDDDAYRRWRDAKLARYPKSLDQITVDIERLEAPTKSEKAAIAAAVAAANMCRYRCRISSRDAEAARPKVAAFARHCGLHEFEDHRSAESDGIVALEQTDAPGKQGYIPYSNRAIGWHTDGYYNYEGPGRAIRSMLLHCAHDAAAGGSNGLLDHEIAYIRLRDASPTLVAALMHPDCLTIPENREDGGEIRPENRGPVFAVDDQGSLLMRYTARRKYAIWRKDPATAAAAEALTELLRDDAIVMRVRLLPGEGLICNNVLHDRSAFENSGDGTRSRLFYRVRSYDKVRPSHLAKGTQA